MGAPPVRIETDGQDARATISPIAAVPATAAAGISAAITSAIVLPESRRRRLHRRGPRFDVSRLLKVITWLLEITRLFKIAGLFEAALLFEITRLLKVTRLLL